MTTNEKIHQLRQLMKDKQLNMYIIQNNDPHQSEYAPVHWRDRTFMSGFTGSVGTLVVTEDLSALWADGRYHIQAAQELEGSEIQLFKQGLPGVPNYDQWLADNLKNQDRVGFNGASYAQGSMDMIKGKLQGKTVEFIGDFDLVDQVWTDRPQSTFNTILEHGPEYSGQTVKERLDLVREQMKKKQAEVFVLSTCDDLAWLFNIRGTDVPNNPFVNSYGIISLDQAYLFIRQACLTDHNRQTLEDNQVSLMAYDSIYKQVKALTAGKKVFLQPSKTSVKIVEALDETCKIIKGMNLTTPLKAIKHEMELNHLYKCQTKDGVAMVKFLHWLEKSVGSIPVTEMSATDKLQAFRAEQDLFQQPSFDAIAGYKDHGAMMHYKATQDHQYTLKPEGLFLIDSGGQYLDGTTDITRTVPLGPLSDQEKVDFTLTLKGLINLSKTQFLEGTTGSNLDILARHAMWQEGIDYKCGTGHGVGFFLGVHEGPQNFSQVPNTVKLEENMIITIEPGVYRAGSHGIRLENTVAVKKSIATEFGQFMTFETIAYCPINKTPLVKDLMTQEEINWLDQYHEKVYQVLAPHLEEDLQAWLRQATLPL